MKTRLGIYCPGNGTGGPWRYVRAILGGLDAAEFDVTVFCDLPADSKLPAGAKVVPLGGRPVEQGGAALADPKPVAPRRPFIPLVPRAARLWAGFGRDTCRLARLLREHPVDVLHTQNAGCEESPVAARLAGVPRMLGTFHVDPSYDLHGRRSGLSHRLLEAVSNRCLDTAIAVSAATGRDWVCRSRFPAKRVVTIRNGIDPDRFRRRTSREAARRALGLPAGALVVGGLGRLEEAKGFEYLLKAAAVLKAAVPDLVVAIAGAGPLRAPLEATARESGVDARFLGFRSDVQPFLDALDVFAMPSLCEALGYALLEAMAAELPCVASAVGGIPEVVVDGRTGLLSPPRCPEQLAARLAPLLLDAELRQRMGVAGRERVKRHFHERDMVAATVNLYRRRPGVN